MRLFIACSLSGPDSRAVYEICERLPGPTDSPLRWVPAENWHVTLLFLGEVAEHLLAVLVERIELVLAQSQCLALQLDHLAWFPNSSKARLLTLAGEPNAQLQQLQQSLGDELRRHDFTIERRAWRPHLTLARYRGVRKRFKPFALPATASFTLRPGHLTLFQSVPGSRGGAPRYLPLQHFELAA